MLKKLEKSMSICKNYLRVKRRNTFYFFNPRFEEEYEGNLIALKNSLLNLKQQIEEHGFKREIFVKYIQNKKNGFRTLLALTGISKEKFQRLITLARVKNDTELNKILLREKWDIEKNSELKEWKIEKIEKMIKTDIYFAQGIINLFFEGSTIPIVTKTLPLFELKKFSIEKLKFNPESMIDTLIRYNMLGNYNASRENNPEKYLEYIFEKNNIKWETGDLPKLVANEGTKKRTMDFIIPSKKNPKIIIECSYLTTTSSGQGDKSKTEIQIKELLEKYYPNSLFIGFVDGIGWYVLDEDLKRMVSAYDYVFTFHDYEINRFLKLLEKISDE
jgi:hypothetical protein